jgi:hypothetical protein
VFLIDDAGVVWGRRASPIEAAPIPIEPGTIQVRLLFPSDATITKYEFSFDFAQSLMDFELVPVFADASLLNHVPGIAARLQSVLTGSGLNVFVYALYSRGAGDLYIPITGLAAHLEIIDNANNLITTNFVEIAPGTYRDSTVVLPPSGSPYTIKVGASAPSGAFDYTTAVAQIWA